MLHMIPIKEMTMNQIEMKLSNQQLAKYLKIHLMKQRFVTLIQIRKSSNQKNKKFIMFIKQMDRINSAKISPVLSSDGISMSSSKQTVANNKQASEVNKDEPPSKNKIDPTQKALVLLTESLLEMKASGHLRKFNTKPFTKEHTTKIKKRKHEIKMESENPTKKRKTAQFSQKSSIEPIKFGHLKMVPLKEYVIPQKYVNLENKTDTSLLSELKVLKNLSESSEEHYLHLYADLLYLNEAAESKSLQKFNVKNISVSNAGVGRTFKIKNCVSYILSLLSNKIINYSISNNIIAEKGG